MEKKIAESLLGNGEFHLKNIAAPESVICFLPPYHLTLDYVADKINIEKSGMMQWQLFAHSIFGSGDVAWWIVISSTDAVHGYRLSTKIVPSFKGAHCASSGNGSIYFSGKDNFRIRFNVREGS